MVLMVCLFLSEIPVHGTLTSIRRQRNNSTQHYCACLAFDVLEALSDCMTRLNVDRCNRT